MKGMVIIMKKSRFISAISSILLCAIAVSCGQTGVNPVSETTLPDTTTAPETDPEYIYPDKTFDGHEFVILNQATCSWANRLIAPEESTGDLINDAMFERNSRIADRFDIKFVEHNVTKDEIPSLVRSTVTAGDDAYDLALFPIDQISGLMLDGCFVDLLGVQSLNLDKPWWDQAVIDAATLDDKCYLASSDITFFPFEATWIIYFNEDRFDDLKVSYPYDLVREGKWTIDKLNEYCTLGASLNGQESFKYDENNNKADYGIITHSQIVQALIFGAGETLIDKTKNPPEFNGDSERLFGIYEKIAALTGTEGAHLDRDKAGGVDTDTKSFCRTAFRTGHFMFLCETLGHIAGLRDFDGNFGVLPMPKYDEKQDGYHSMVASWGTLMTTIPMSASDPERTGVILDALAYDSYKNLMEPYYETYLTQKGARNEDSADMLKIIRDTRVINLGHMFNWTNTVLSSITSSLENGDASVASVIDSAKTSIKESIEKTMKSLNG